MTVALAAASGCGDSNTPVVLDPPSDTAAIDYEKDAREGQDAMKNYDPRKGSPPSSGDSSPASL